MIHKRNETSFKDFLFLTISGLAALFVLAFIIINPPTKTQDVPSKAEYLLIVEWDDFIGDDIDLWVRDPNRNIVSFRNTYAGIMSLEKDDLGYSNDSFTDQYGETHVIMTNREVVTFRGIHPGEYTAAVQVYAFREYNVLATTFDTYGIPYLSYDDVANRRKIRFTLIKVNPTYNEVFKVEKEYTDKGQEIHLLNFTVREDGEIIDMNTTPVGIVYRNAVAGESGSR